MSGPPRRIKESKKKIKSTDKNPEKENELPSNLVFKVMQKVVIQIGRERERSYMLAILALISSRII